MGYSGPGCGILNLQVTERSVTFDNENKNKLKENVRNFMSYIFAVFICLNFNHLS